MITPLLYVILSIVPATIVALIIDVWHRFHYDGRRPPISDKLLRPPGESCRQKVEELTNRIFELIIWVVVFPSTFLLLFLSINGTSVPAHQTIKMWLPSLALGFFTVGLMTIRLVNLFKERNHWRLGFSGERAVGELLNRLMADGCRVCHDFPLTDTWNIDHIVVAPSGVYAIETKTKRKRSASPQQKAHEVIYDGKTLEFPFYSDDEDLAHARDQADRLAEFLGQSLKTPQPVKPVITLPGWYVINRGRGEVVVANPKLLDREILTHEPPVLSPERIKDIARVLEHKCRDVEF